MTTVKQARQALRDWLDHRPDNFFTAESNLPTALRFYLSPERYEEMLPRLNRAGADAATRIDAAARLEDEIGNHPRLQRYSGIGERTESIVFHPAHDEIGRMVWSSGIMSLQREPGHNVEQMALFYLFAHNGEMGHLCSLACTFGMVRLLQSVADEEVRERFLPPLLGDDYSGREHAAQFLTEVQGGSDVGANTMEAASQPDGTWRLTGEKWFCSNINADQFLMTARPVGAGPGTKGLGLFAVPRSLDDGTTNSFYVRRLKDKLGTRTLASAEADFDSAVAYQVGPLDQGFKNLVELVLNTSRLANSVLSVGIMRRALIDAQSYAGWREAFGSRIVHYPLVQETLADMLSETYAGQASSFYLPWLLDRIETGTGDEDDPNLYRLLVNVNKYWTSVRGTQVVHQGIEVLGGNGAIETFSVLPRLYRDMIVPESWEGTHNILSLQVLRDCARYRLHESFAKVLEGYLDLIRAEELSVARDQARSTLQEVMNTFRTLLDSDEQYMQAHARRLIDQTATTAQAVLLLREAQWEINGGFETMKPDVITHYVNQFVDPTYNPLDDPDLLERTERLAIGAKALVPQAG